MPSYALPDSLAARYDSLAKPTSSSDSLPRKQSIIIDLDDEDDSDYSSKSFNDNTALDYASWNQRCEEHIPVLQRAPVDDDELEEVLDPTLAALEARARQRAAERALLAAASTADGEAAKAPLAQLFIKPEIPDANPLIVKVRIDSTIEKPRKAWCEKQGFSADMTKNVFFTWKGTRIYDSTTVKRLGIQVDKHGNVSVVGDPNIYDDDNLPKVVVIAWTEELYQQRKKEDAAEAAAKRKAAESSPVVEERDPTPEPVPQVTKIRLFLKAKGKEEFRLSVNPVCREYPSYIPNLLLSVLASDDSIDQGVPDTTFGHIAHVYKSKFQIDKDQPLTLTFDGDRLSPLDPVANTEIEDMDAIEVLFK